MKSEKLEVVNWKVKDDCTKDSDIDAPVYEANLCVGRRVALEWITDILATGKRRNF